MSKRFEFDPKAFKANYSWKPQLSCLIVALLLNFLVFLYGTWTIAVCMGLISFWGIITVCLYIQQKFRWKTANIELAGEEIHFYIKKKDGFEDNVLTYEDSLTTIYSISTFQILRKKMHIEGNIKVQVCKDAKHKNIKTKWVSSIVLPMYFEKQEELVGILRSFH